MQDLKAGDGFTSENLRSIRPSLDLGDEVSGVGAGQDREARRKARHGLAWDISLVYERSASLKSASVRIVTERFVLRPLQLSDVGERYLSWMRDVDALKFIAAAARTEKLADLNEYVREKVDRDDVLFLGIFEQGSDLHIGNIKYEPLDSAKGEATMGILIGDASYRGKGVTGEVIKASSEWLKSNRGVRRILLGVSSDNEAAMRAYEKVGFVSLDPLSDHASALGRMMVWSL